MTLLHFHPLRSTFRGDLFLGPQGPRGPLGARAPKAQASPRPRGPQGPGVPKAQGSPRPMGPQGPGAPKVQASPRPQGPKVPKVQGPKGPPRGPQGSKLHEFMVFLCYNKTKTFNVCHENPTQTTILLLIYFPIISPNRRF